MSNEIILLQIVYRPLKYLFFFTYENENSKTYPMLTMFYQWPKIPRNLIFWIFLHYNKAFGLWHSYILYTLAHKVFVVKSWAKKICLNIPYESLNFFFHEIKFGIFFKNLVGIFKLVQIWHYMHRIIPL